MEYFRKMKGTYGIIEAMLHLLGPEGKTVVLRYRRTFSSKYMIYPQTFALASTLEFSFSFRKNLSLFFISEAFKMENDITKFNDLLSDAFKVLSKRK
jgi:hypothetical protein